MIRIPFEIEENVGRVDLVKAMAV